MQYIKIYCINYWMQTRFRHLKSLLIIYLIILSQSMEMATSKPKHVAAFFKLFI
jgi:hypothetical protein